MGELGKHPKLVQLRFDVIINGDGVQNTLLLATKYHTCGANGGSLWFDPGKNEIASLFAATFGANMNLWQNAPTEAACDPTAGTAVGLLPDTIHVALCDASCRTVKVQMDKYAWQSAHTYSGRGELPFHWDE
jgi:hypothetical protein